ncbi:hypothetical protein FOYG_02316 [Fusarium oxysporum NRRL 32931]|uniref:Ubiquinol-cytochrome-c reductase cytochrome c1 n=1 Tax=Fusarium oxysporum NRRL 32931 TaxID=660029 RepID=W9IW02_FUSOX|nr:hypothetical protein FOYG_02316 [Fusarium oxysporum NRRL 32931]
MDLVIGTELNERVIYQATKNIFNGQYAKLRDRGVVRASINNHLQRGSLVQQVVTRHGFDAVSREVLKLLSDKVYESTSIARQRFPDLFEPSTAQNTARTQLEEEATRTEQAALKGIEETHSDDNQDIRDLQAATTAVHDASDSTASDIAGSSLLFPVYLPFPTEHLLMEKLQKVLETACYEYGVRELSSIMQHRDWDCPESVELNQWAELLGHEGNLKRQGTGKALKELLRSIAQIRHTAVHRLRTNSRGLEQFLADAEDLARILGDNIYTQVISQMRIDAQSTLTELAQNKQFIQLQLEMAQEEIAKQRAELDQKEQENLRRTEREDKRYRAMAGQRLQQALNLVGNFAIAPESENMALDGMGGDDVYPVSDDDSNLDHAEQFEDCSES